MRVLLALCVTLGLAVGCSKSSTIGDDAGPDITFDAAMPVDGGPTPVDGGPAPRCGDRSVDPGEECDDGNDRDGDGCSSACEVEIECGNGRLDPTEECDDGGTADGDGCDSDCRREAYCGDGTVDDGEICDDGNNRSGDGCRSDCQSVEDCGNNVVDAVLGERCDDGNMMDGDGCSSTCQLEMCGDGTVMPPEQCDDENVLAFDGCGPDCRDEHSLILSEFAIGDDSVGCDFSGDGEIDNRFAEALGPLVDLANDMFIGNAIEDGQLIFLMHALALDDPAMANDPSFSLAWFLGQDADGDASNNLTGMGRFTPDASAFDAMGNPTAAFQSRVASRALTGGPEDIEVPLGFFELEVKQSRLEGTTRATAGEVAGIDDGLLCGGVPVAVLAFLPNIIDMFSMMPAPPCDPDVTNTSLADVLIGGTPRGFIFPLRGAAPDVDLDGDGLERFEVTSRGEMGCQPVISACIDGNGTRVESPLPDGSSCATDARFQDGWSAAFPFAAVRAIIERGDGG
ncbi:MAG: DUF4215 domain-containing protein [Polyangiales bacterium]